jgi:hypothetical protein
MRAYRETAFASSDELSLAINRRNFVEDFRRSARAIFTTRERNRQSSR